MNQRTKNFVKIRITNCELFAIRQLKPIPTQTYIIVFTEPYYMSIENYFTYLIKKSQCVNSCILQLILYIYFSVSYYVLPNGTLKPIAKLSRHIERKIMINNETYEKT